MDGKKIKIIKDLLIFTFQNHPQEVDVENYLDIQTGKIIQILDGYLEDADFEIEDIQDDSKRFLYIEPIQSNESYKLVENFINELSNQNIQNKLIEAINQDKPFKKFKNVLNNYQDVEDKWYKHEEKQFENKAIVWLKKNNINFELI